MTIRFYWVVIILSVSVAGCGDGMTGAIWTAIEKNDVNKVDSFIRDGGDVGIVQLISRDTLLMHAFRHQSKDCFSRLLEAGAPTDVQLRDGTYLMHWLAGCQDSWWIEKALEHGADPGLWSTGEGTQAGTPIHFAIVEEQLQNLELLIQAGVDLDAAVEGEQLIALADASLSGRFEMVEMLLEYGALPTAGPEGKDFLVTLQRRGFRRDKHNSLDRIIQLLAAQGYGKDVFAGSDLGDRSYEERLAARQNE